MADKDHAVQAGDDLFETFAEQIKQVLEHLYDFAYLQQHVLARFMIMPAIYRQKRQDGSSVMN